MKTKLDKDAYIACIYMYPHMTTCIRLRVDNAPSVIIVIHDVGFQEH